MPHMPSMKRVTLGTQRYHPCAMIEQLTSRQFLEILADLKCLFQLSKFDPSVIVVVVCFQRKRQFLS